MKPAEPYLGQLARFARQVLLPAVPRRTWWALGLTGFLILNLAFGEELWPHYPRAKQLLIPLLMLSFGPLPWLGARTAQRVRQRVQGWWWQGFWQMVAFVAYLAATALSILLLLFGLLVGLL